MAAIVADAADGGELDGQRQVGCAYVTVTTDGS